MAAAFVLALQMLLAGILSTRMAVAAPDDAFTICYGSGHSADGDDGQSGKIHHASCVICALASFAPPVDTSAASLAVVAASHAAVFATRRALLRGDDHHNPRTSQGPPQAA
jgi:hypothetical protein